MSIFGLNTDNENRMNCVYFSENLFLILQGKHGAEGGELVYEEVTIWKGTSHQ